MDRSPDVAEEETSEAGAGEAPPRSNRGFWTIAIALGAVAVAMVVAIVVNRPLKDTIAHTESDLSGALALARGVERSTGSFAGADAASLAALDDTRRYVGPDEPSDGPGTVSVSASAGEWAAAVQARPDACFFIRQPVGGATAYEVATGPCTGSAARSASGDRW